MSIADQVALENLRKDVDELKAIVQNMKLAPDLTAKVEDLENKYRMMNARMGWKKE